MEHATDDERGKLRVPVKVEATWFFGTDVECVVDGRVVTLCAAKEGSEVQLSTLDFESRSGRVLHFRSLATHYYRGCIEFAGMGRDAVCAVTCRDEETAVTVAARIEDYGSQGILKAREIRMKTSPVR